MRSCSVFLRSREIKITRKSFSLLRVSRSRDGTRDLRSRQQPLLAPAVLGRRCWGPRPPRDGKMGWPGWLGGVMRWFLWEFFWVELEVYMVGIWQMEGETVKMFETYAVLQDTEVQGILIPGNFATSAWAMTFAFINFLRTLQYLTGTFPEMSQAGVPRFHYVSLHVGSWKQAENSSMLKSFLNIRSSQLILRCESWSILVPCLASRGESWSVIAFLQCLLVASWLVGFWPAKLMYLLRCSASFCKGLHKYIVWFATFSFAWSMV